MNLQNYNASLIKIMHKLKISKSMIRVCKLLGASFLLVHLFASFFHMVAKFNDYDSDTWVFNRALSDPSILDVSSQDMYYMCLYWAF